MASSIIEKKMNSTCVTLGKTSPLGWPSISERRQKFFLPIFTFILPYFEKARVAVQKVFLYSRSDNHYDRTRNVEIRLSDELPTTGEEEFTGGELLGTFKGPATRRQKVEILSGPGWENKFGQFLVIQMNVGQETKTYLNLKEVQVFGHYRQKCTSDFC